MPKIIKKTEEAELLSGNNFCTKPLTGEWKENELSTLFSLLSEEFKPFSNESKKKLPLFGFNKKIGFPDNEQMYPLNYVTGELDIPHAAKEKIKKGNKKLNSHFVNFFKQLFEKLKSDEGLNYWLLYITPSCCGLRFVLKLNTPIKNEMQYKQTLLEFLKQLDKYEIDKFYYDIRINQGWFVPTFKDFIDFRKSTLIVPEFIYEIEKSPKSSSFYEIQKDSDIHIKVTEEIIDYLHKTDQSITFSYSKWIEIAFSLSDTFSEEMGRVFFHKLSSRDKCKYDSKITDAQWTKCYHANIPGRLPFKVLIQEALKKGFKVNPEYEVALRYKRFWNDTGHSIDINQNDFADFLKENGFYKLDGKVDNIVYKKNNLIQSVSIEFIAGYLKEYVNSFAFNPSDEIKPKVVLNVLMKKYKTLIADCIPFLDSVSQPKSIDKIDSATVAYQNGYILLKKGCPPQMNSLADIPECIWKDSVINRKIKIEKYDPLNSEFGNFIYNLSDSEIPRFDFFRSALGYILHGYKNPAKNYAVMLVDEVLGKESKADGGTGKGITVRGIMEFLQKKVIMVDGKSFDPDNRFHYQRVKSGDRVIVIQDLKRGLNFDHFFSAITDGLTIEKKFGDETYLPYEESPKFIFTSNYPVLGSGGESEERRKIIIPCSNYFYRGHTPLDEYGHLLFDEWNSEEWNKFDNFMLDCLQFYLDHGILLYRSEGYGISELMIRTSADFVEFGNKISKKKYDKKIVFDDFMNEYEHPDLTQRTFTIWLKALSDFKEWDVVESKSNGKSYITFS